MSRSTRRQITALLAAVIVLGGGFYLALKISRHQPSGQTSATGATPTITYGEPTVVGTTPSITAPSAASAVQDEGSYSIAIPAGSNAVNSLGGNEHELRFKVDNRYSVAVQSEALRPGEAFVEIASLYGPISSGKQISFGGHHGLLFKNLSGGYVTWTAVSLKGRTVYTLQTYGPQANAGSARKLIVHLASSATLKQS